VAPSSSPAAPGFSNGIMPPDMARMVNRQYLFQHLNSRASAI